MAEMRWLVHALETIGDELSSGMHALGVMWGSTEMSGVKERHVEAE